MKKLSQKTLGILFDALDCYAMDVDSNEQLTRTHREKILKEISKVEKELEEHN